MDRCTMNICCTVGLLATLALVASVAADEARCMREEGASDADAQVLRESRPPVTRTQKCFFDCMYRASQFSDGKRFTKDGFIAYVMRVVGHDGLKFQVLSAMADKCVHLESDDRCQLAADIEKCLFGQHRKD
ncbi:uncharacterized protein LOC120429297 [Culex pipiens pallens]|uniref:uncharacterized protein LOC120429297 n=1 Tax=Culex pipiens pallens TaxID=42434 RepID=UPI001953A86B|nr:uncharacterized protein LOC120429297 [Culex pipiens pallens]